MFADGERLEVIQLQVVDSASLSWQAHAVEQASCMCILILLHAGGASGTACSLDKVGKAPFPAFDLSQDMSTVHKVHAEPFCGSLTILVTLQKA